MATFAGSAATVRGIAARLRQNTIAFKMASVNIVRVTDRKGLDDFIQFHYDLYRGNPYDVPNLRSDEVNTLGKERNAAFDFCEADYFLAYKDGRLCGRVAAIINRRANERWGRKSVRFGWIDFVDDREVSAALLGAVEQWGRERGMEEIVGPLGFTDMDPEGMLTWGFDQLGTQATIYNYPYYPEHIEAMGGWEKDNDYVEYKMFVPEKVPEKYVKIAALVEKRYNLHVRKLTRREVLREGYGQKIFEVINETFKDLYGYSQLTPRQIDQYVAMYLPMACPWPTSTSSPSLRTGTPGASSWAWASPSPRSREHCRSAATAGSSPSAGGTCCARSSSTRPRALTCS